MKRFLLLLTIIAGCSADEKTISGPTNGPSTPDTLRVLFVGNSLTYTNNLPALCAEIALHDSVTLIYGMLANPNYSLGDHLIAGVVQKEIAKGIYDVVVVQQGPSALPESQVLLLEYARQFAALCSLTNKTKLAVYTVWPSLARSFDHDNVILSYANAAAATNALLCPAGKAWKLAWSVDPTLPLYSSDDFHPSIHGSVLAAVTIYGTLRHKTSFAFVPREKCSWSGEISETQWNVMTAAAVNSYAP